MEARWERTTSTQWFNKLDPPLIERRSFTAGPGLLQNSRLRD